MQLHCSNQTVFDMQGDGWQITLNDRALKTPARQSLVVPTYPLALAIAAEWEWQVSCYSAQLQLFVFLTACAHFMQDNRIRPFTMPLMSLAATAIDQPKSRDKVIDTMLQYLDTDAICCREEPGKLADMQAEVIRDCNACIKGQACMSVSAA